MHHSHTSDGQIHIIRQLPWGHGWSQCSQPFRLWVDPLFLLSYCHTSSNAVLSLINILFARVGGVGVPQQRPWDVLGGLLRLPPGWSHSCPHWSSTVSQGTSFPQGGQWLPFLAKVLKAKLVTHVFRVDTMRIFFSIPPRPLYRLHIILTFFTPDTFSLVH